MCVFLDYVHTRRLRLSSSKSFFERHKKNRVFSEETDDKRIFSVSLGISRRRMGNLPYPFIKVCSLRRWTLRLN